MQNTRKIRLVLVTLLIGFCGHSPAAWPLDALPPVDAALQNQRALSALNGDSPEIQTIEQNGVVVWQTGQSDPAPLSAGSKITLYGHGFGAGPDVDYAKIVLGHSRVLERTLPMYVGAVHLLKKLFYEKPQQFDSWPTDIQSWNDSQIAFTFPFTASEGPLAVQIQKRVGSNLAIQDPNQIFSLWDPMTERITNPKVARTADVISQLGPARLSNLIPLSVNNPTFSKLVENGEKIFWNYEFNLALVHHVAHLDWDKILNGQAINPVTNQAANPQQLFGAIPLNAAEVPAAITKPIYWDNFPTPNPLRPLVRPPLTAGYTYPTQYVGYVHAQSIDPISNLKGSWIGMSCAACHTQRITYESSPGHFEAQVFAGLPNPAWSMKWSALGNMYGVTGKETGSDGQLAAVDKTNLLFAVPPGTGEHTLVRPSDDGSIYANDHFFSPIAIPIITRHTPVRRALSRSEMIAGFEGSYLHSEEPDGALGAMSADALKSLTAYMTQLDEANPVLQNLGIYRWLQKNGRLDQVANASEGSFMEAGYASYPILNSHLAHGQTLFEKNCASCHANNFGTHTDENMIPLNQVGTYFSPTLYERTTQSVRTAIIHNLYWVEARGLLHDGHVKSITDLLNPDRCNPGTSLYNSYYQLNPNTFHIPKGNGPQETALRNQAYFVDVSWDQNNLYWDYQSMRSNFGPLEFQSAKPVPLPMSPHPWCAPSAEDVTDLTEYLLTL